MPLSVDIRINGRLIETFVIGRLEPLKGQDREHEYVIRKVYGDDNHTSADELRREVVFTHRYSDGASRCVERALGAWHS